MFRIVIGYVLKASVVAVPLIVPMFVAMGARGIDEKQAGAVLSILLLTCVFAYETVEHAIPRLNAQRFRDDYLREAVNKYFAGSAQHLRFNVMMARRRWHALWVFRTFHWASSIGFSRGQHHDAKLHLAEWQGVCGQALRQERPLFVDFRGLPKTKPHWRPWKNPYWLFRWQVLRTRSVLVIGSVPLLVKCGTGGNPHYKVVGVLNVDAVSEEGAKWLTENWAQLEQPLLEVGGFLAILG